MIMHKKHLPQCLAQNKCSISYYFYCNYQGEGGIENDSQVAFQSYSSSPLFRSVLLEVQSPDQQQQHNLRTLVEVQILRPSKNYSYKL